MLLIKSYKFGIILQNLMVILKSIELNVIIVERIMHVILFLMEHSYLKVCKKIHFVVDKKQKVFVLEPKKEKDESEDQNMSTLKAIGYNYDQCRQTPLKIVIIDELPFNFVEELYNLNLTILSRFTVMKDCLEIYVEENERIKIALRVSEICIKNCLIGQVSNHMGEIIGQVMRIWGIDKLIIVTVENINSNNVTISYLKNMMANWSFSILSNEHLYVRCCTHVVNLIVSDDLKEIKSV
uniref:Uncharacterized protein n=1 Tax=Salix viminalis TaxID=40686 RepID=A0A6N2LRE9_SALVM